MQVAFSRGGIVALTCTRPVSAQRIVPKFSLVVEVATRTSNTWCVVVSEAWNWCLDPGLECYGQMPTTLSSFHFPLFNQKRKAGLD